MKQKTPEERFARGVALPVAVMVVAAVCVMDLNRNVGLVIWVAVLIYAVCGVLMFERAQQRPTRALSPFVLGWSNLGLPMMRKRQPFE